MIIEEPENPFQNCIEILISEVALQPVTSGAATQPVISVISALQLVISGIPVSFLANSPLRLETGRDDVPMMLRHDDE